MIIIPNFLTRCYQKNEDPFISLNDLPLKQANKAKINHCKLNEIGDFYAQDDYLIHRLEIEKWIYEQLIKKGGKPTYKTPVYMTLGDGKVGYFDIREDIQKNAIELQIPLDKLDLSAISFTFPDSMYKLIIDDSGKLIRGERTNTPQVYLYHELQNMMEIYKFCLCEHYVEAQVWNREMLYQYLNNE